MVRLCDQIIFVGKLVALCSVSKIIHFDPTVFWFTQSEILFQLSNVQNWNNLEERGAKGALGRWTLAGTPILTRAARSIETQNTQRQEQIF